MMAGSLSKSFADKRWESAKASEYGSRCKRGSELGGKKQIEVPTQAKIQNTEQISHIKEAKKKKHENI